MKERTVKFIFKIFIFIIIVIIFFVSMFFCDYGRRVLLTTTGCFLQTQNINFMVNGLDEKCSHISKIQLEFPNKFKVVCEGIQINRKNIFDRFNINIDQVIFDDYAYGNSENTNTKENVSENINENINENNRHLKNVDTVVFIIKKLRQIISSVVISKGKINSAGKKYYIDKLYYKSHSNKDRFYCRSNQGNIIDLNIKWKNGICSKGTLDFKKIFDFDGQCEIRNVKNRNSEYKIAINGYGWFLNADGEFEDFEKSIVIEEAFLGNKKQKYRLHGEINIIDKKAYLKSLVKLNDLITILPQEISVNFENVIADIQLNYFFDTRLKSLIQIDFKRENKIIGEILGKFHNSKLELLGDIGWINICGYQLTKIDCNIDSFKRADISIFGNEFSLSCKAEKQKSRVLVNEILFNAKNYGNIKLKTPFFINDKTPNFDFTIDFERLDFFKKIVSISGDIFGEFSYKDETIDINCEGKKLIYNNNYELLNYDVVVKNYSGFIDAKNFVCFGAIFQNISLSLAENGKLMFDGYLKNTEPIKIIGKFDRSLKKIRIDQGSVTSKNMRCDIKTSDLDFLNKSFHMLGEVSGGNKTKQKGTLDIYSDNKKITINLNSFQPHIIGNIFDTWIPKCKIDGSVRLDKTTSYMSGKGNLVISDLLSRKSSIEVKGNLDAKGITINSHIKNHVDSLKGEAFFPIVIQNNNEISAKALPLKINLSGKVSIEHLFELPDRYDARGLLNCNLTVSGNINNPVVNGTLKLQKAYFVLNDIYLRNGDISLVCSNNNITVNNSRFIDRKKKELKLNGYGKLFFDNFVPNIKTNLDLIADNFILFDSDELNITLAGRGKITGNIDDLLISGNVDLTKCNIKKKGMSSNKEDDEIVIENEINVKNKPQENVDNEKDFCRYDIVLHCPKISFEGDVFDSVFFGDLKLSSYKQQATLVGNLQLKKGKLELFGKRLVFRKGKVEFIEEYPFDPKASILCENTFNDMVVSLKIKNTPGVGASFALHSIPNHSQETILSRMLFGKDLKYLSVSEAAQFAQAMSGFKKTGYIFSILNTFKGVGLIDSISFSNTDSRSNSLNINNQTSTTQGNMNISAGKYLGDNLFISVNKNNDDTTSFDIDYSITPKISVKANTNGEAGISWKYKY